MAGTAPKITADQATQSKANALAFQAQNLANRNATPAPVQKVTADQATQSKANALAFQAQNLAQRNPANVPTNVGSNITAGNTRTPPPTVLPNVTQPTQGAMLSADIQSGQEATNRAREAEMAVSRTQGLDTTTQAKQIADYIAGKTATNTPQGTTTPATGTSPTGTSLDAQVQQYKTNYDQVTADLTNAYNNFQGQTALQDQAYSGTVDPAKQELNDINQRLNEETLAGRRRVEAVLTIPGITKAQAQDKINEISRVNTSTQADLAIIQMAKQGQYDSAKEIADRKVSALIEEQKIKIDTLKFVFDNNKELFTKAEQRQFEVAQADRERKLNQEEKRLQEVNAVALSALEAGAPTRVVEKMFKAKTLAEATKLGGQYVGALDRQVKLANIEQSKAATRASNRANQPVVGTGANYNNNQIKYITSLNEAVSKNDTYKKTTNAKTYTDNVITALSQGTGTGDLAAINQFQKVIDEGAVTRDQDVKLIQQSQSLVNSIQSKFKKLGTGQQLSPQLRNEMKDAVAQLYNGQVQALQKDPYIASKLAETRLYGVNATDTILGEISNINQSSQQPQVAPEKEQIFNSVLGIPNSNPTNTTGNAIFGNQATTQTIIPFNLNNFKK